PERPEIMAQIVESIEGLAEACRFFEVPVTGGNVSLYNETLGSPIFPTPVVGIVGTRKTAVPVGIPFQHEARAVILLGGLGFPESDQLGGTQYAKVICNSLWGVPPHLDMEYEKRVQSAIRELVLAGAVESAHDLSDGGLAVALAECSFGPAGVGADIQLSSDMAPELLLFHESPSRILVSTATPDAVFASAKKNSVEAVAIGVTLNESLIIRNKNAVLIHCPVKELESAWAGALEHHLLHDPVLV
ncbi:MAG TPA: AIR synthase-related protein, partial [Bryobacteraceae bacterium]|nr:AIR synthase-related protein [Bryobacteraceae bacterium]